MSFALKIALRFLKSSKGQTLLIMSGIAIGVAVQIFIGLLIQGLQESLVDKTIGSSSHITLRSRTNDRVITGPMDIIKTIEESSENEKLKSISPVSEAPAIIKLEKTDVSGFLRGFNFEYANKIYGFDEKIVSGVLPVKENEIIIGKGISDEFKLKEGDEINIIIPPIILVQRKLKITGIFDLGIGAANNSWIISTLGTVQTLNFRPNTASAIEIQVKEPFSADKTALEIENLLKNDDLKISNWKADNKELLTGLMGQSVSSIMIQTFVLIAVALGIASVLAISVIQKSKQVGILKAMGIKDRTASLIFLIQGLLLGIGGAIIGALLGLGLSYSFTIFAKGPDGSPVVPLFINFGFIAFSMVIAIISPCVASIVPAIRSSKLSPVEVIRNG